MATILIPTALRSYTAGRTEVEVPGGGSLRQVIDKLDAAYPGLKAQLVEDDGIRAGIAIAINDELTSAGLLEQVPEDGSVNILPAIGGGSQA
ncbi:MAG: molybdopterin synthase sulfur carrier subunit [Dehalococcoidia bacterium]|nr:molybdopterin synthase sulfur carrier subunit [Dehalococcoidia bacterium]